MEEEVTTATMVVQIESKLSRGNIRRFQSNVVKGEVHLLDMHRITIPRIVISATESLVLKS